MNHPFPLSLLAPRLSREVSRLSLGRFPTPVERSEKLSSLLGCSLFLKRDDQSGKLYGGNKVRKLEFLLGEAKKKGFDTLLTAGGLGSHHVLATALYGNREGFATAAVLYPQPRTPHVQETLSLIQGAGVRVKVAPVPLAPFAAASLYTRLTREGRRVGILAPGGSSPLGTLGYVNAALELALQIEQKLLPVPDVLVAPLGSCGTVAGLALGLRLAGLRTRVLAVRVVDLVVANQATVHALAASTARLLARAGCAEASRARVLAGLSLSIEHKEFGQGYGYPTPNAERTLAHAREAGLSLETTYTAKALSALFSRKADFAGKTVLFWNTFSSADLTSLPRK